jgi:deferrochelatase/peroxidase EfeB
MQSRRASGRNRTGGVPIGDRGPGQSYRPDDVPPSLFGSHQPGVTTPVLDHVAFAALDLRAAVDRPALQDLVAELSAAAERLMRAARRPPGEAGPAGGLTLTLGLGPGIFGDRFGLAARRPVALAPLPPFSGDALDPATSGGDVCIQACAADPGGAAAALGRLVAVAAPAARVRWTQHGSMHRAPGDRPGGRPRNLLGFKDATSNPRRGKELDRHVWIGGRERMWMVGGTFLVVRRVRVLLEAWSALSPGEQERVIGRHRDSGAPLGRGHEFDAMPLDGAVPADAHARLAAPRTGEAPLLRRGYSFDNGIDEHGERDAGLLLLLYQRDPRRQFVPLQRRLADGDALTRYTRAVGSACFAIPPGARPGQALAHDLLAP